jgi:hypothetical protein
MAQQLVNETRRGSNTTGPTQSCNVIALVGEWTRFRESVGDTGYSRYHHRLTVTAGFRYGRHLAKRSASTRLVPPGMYCPWMLFHRRGRLRELMSPGQETVFGVCGAPDLAAACGNTATRTTRLHSRGWVARSSDHAPPRSHYLEVCVLYRTGKKTGILASGNKSGIATNFFRRSIPTHRISAHGLSNFQECRR